ncbi:protein SlyX homolog [Striga asiatica]|uniref:Protein SlyX homolog n=1 Tax=Striga asiatica TaxID=4170 RepID=A0A5A7R3T6_STRAF|nr:protein SlyX homolog [Striga asiatica]
MDVGYESGKVRAQLRLPLNSSIWQLQTLSNEQGHIQLYLQQTHLVDPSNLYSQTTKKYRSYVPIDKHDNRTKSPLTPGLINPTGAGLLSGTGTVAGSRLVKPRLLNEQ